MKLMLHAACNHNLFTIGQYSYVLAVCYLSESRAGEGGILYNSTLP